ncbi:hypothetical protein [Xenorhabdus sp. SGI246]|uniref:hypothetical protein n=1 Tax=Xenorhabdus sp. SGI246 TaxID=3158263 RepID=UPI00349F5627
MTSQNSESVFGASFHYAKELIQQNRRRWLLRKWRSYWRNDKDIREKIRYSEYLCALFNFESRYRVIKLFVRADQERGKI